MCHALGHEVHVDWLWVWGVAAAGLAVCVICFALGEAIRFAEDVMLGGSGIWVVGWAKG